MVLIVGVVTLLIVPRSAIPDGLPPPSVTLEDVRATRAANDARAREAVAMDPSHAVQLVGALFRAYGRAEWEGDARAKDQRREALGKAVAVAFLDGESLDRLRAYQARLFVDAYLRMWKTGEMSDELIELGGGSLHDLELNGWLRSAAQAPPHADLVLSAYFKRRFAKVVAKDHPALAPDPVEERLLLGYFMEHPPVGGILGGREAASPGIFVLKRIDELAALEPSYPVLFARGIVLFRMAKFEDAAQAFDAYLRASDDGRYRLRAVNYLKTSLEHAKGAEL